MHAESTAARKPSETRWNKALARLMALVASVLPGHPAGEPVTGTHRVDEVVHGRPPAFRA